MQASNPGPFTPHNVETIRLRSDVNGRIFDLRIGLPASYGAGNAHYPVFFVLDAELIFGTALEAAALEAMWSKRPLAPEGTKLVPEVIVVGVALPDTEKDPFRRNFEFMPTMDVRSFPGRIKEYMDELSGRYGSSVRFGGAPEFLEMLRQEALPLIDEHYRTDPTRRLLMGLSAGGTFACYTLFTKPDSFTDYLIASPGFLGDDLFEREAAWTKQCKDLKARVFLSAGEAETEDPTEIFSQTARLAQILRGRAHPGLTLHTWFIPAATHVQTAGPSISRGLVALLGHDQAT